MKIARKFKQIMMLVVIVPLMLMMLGGCSGDGRILITEDGKGTGFTANIEDFSSNETVKMSLEKGHEVQVIVECQDGEIGLTVTSKSGIEPYTGNKLQTGSFTVTISITDKYTFLIKGKNATGKVTIKNLGFKED